MTVHGRYKRRKSQAARAAVVLASAIFATFAVHSPVFAEDEPDAVVTPPAIPAAPSPSATPSPSAKAPPLEVAPTSELPVAAPQVLLGAKPASPKPAGPSVTLADGALLSLSADDVPQGGVIVIRRDFPEHTVPSSAPVAHLDKQDVPFFQDGQAYIGLLAVPHEQKPGPAKVEVEVGGTTQTLTFKVHDGGFPHETLKVEAKLVNPPKKAMIRIRKEQAEIGELYHRVTKEIFWRGKWIKPIDSPMRSPYGTRRLYNGEERNYHGGLDLKAAIGTPIHAAAGGKVVLAKDLYFTGNTVMIDHGYGLISLYAHMSKIKVKVGQKVEQGDLLGLSGKTGRVTGPHLHWQIILHKNKINPSELMKALGGEPIT